MAAQIRAAGSALSIQPELMSSDQSARLGRVFFISTRRFCHNPRLGKFAE
jgi:hypothetical protein